MGTRLQNKISIDVAADNSSLDSLSFAGLVCIQDQQLKAPPTNTANQINKHDPEFEFSSATTDSSAHDSNKTFSADMSISNGQLLPQAFQCQLKQSPVTNQPCYEGPLPATQSSSKSSSDNYNNSMKISDKPAQEVRNQSYKEHSARSSWFGHKIFRSFVSPCRECHAVKPTTKAQTMPRENVKLH